MPLTITNCFVMLLGVAFTWLFLFSLFREKSNAMLGVKLGALVLVLFFPIAKASYDVYAYASRAIFLMHADGEVSLALTPLQAKPSDSKPCERLKDSNGKPITMTYLNNDKVQCGYIWGATEKKVTLIPFKRLTNHQTIYWVSPDMQIIGPAPKALEQVEPAKQ